MNRKEFTELLLNQDVTYRAAYAKSAIGAERYLQRDESIAFSYGEQIVLTQENIGISLPSDYVHFYSSFDVKNAIGDLLDLPDDFCNGGGFSDINNRLVAVGSLKRRKNAIFPLDRVFFM